jgi:hypothetical protein
MKRFGDATRVAAQKKQGQGEHAPITVAILDRDVTFEFPGAGQVTYLSMIATTAENDVEAASALLTFLVSMTNDEGGRILKRSVLNPHSGFDLDDVPDVIRYLIEEWGGFPTAPASASSATQATTGRTSTGATRRAGSTRSTSRSTASSTRSTTSSLEN